MRIQHDTGARIRLAAALTASIIVHAWLVHGYGERERSQPVVSGVPLHATLVETAAAKRETGARQSEMAVMPAEKAASDAMRAPSVSTRDVLPERRGVETARTTGASVQLSALPTPQDPTYYSTRSLDVFPSRLSAWDTSAIRAAAQGAGGSARATLLIDETGVVNEVESIQGTAPGGIETAIRDLFLAVRFSPARKDGRVVRARVLVNLDF